MGAHDACWACPEVPLLGELWLLSLAADGPLGVPVLWLPLAGLSLHRRASSLQGQLSFQAHKPRPQIQTMPVLLWTLGPAAAEVGRDLPEVRGPRQPHSAPGSAARLGFDLE